MEPRHVASWDLRTGTVLEPAELERFLDAYLRSALPLGVAGDIENTLVLLYPRTVGGFDPASAEFVVVYETIWLE